MGSISIQVSRPEMREVARRLGIAERALRRTLASEGTSFRAISDSALRERTLSLLRDPSLSFEEVAERAGFSEPSGLYCAVRRWTQLSPVQFRYRMRRKRESLDDSRRADRGAT